MITIAPDILYTVDEFIGGDFYTLRKDKLNVKILLHVFLPFFVRCVDGVQCVCALFLTFSFDPYLISRLITDSSLDQLE